MPLPLPEAYRVKSTALFRETLKGGGWTYRSLAHEVGCSKSEIHWIASGNRTRPGTAQAIAATLGVDRAFLFTLDSSNQMDNRGHNPGRTTVGGHVR